MFIYESMVKIHIIYVGQTIDLGIKEKTRVKFGTNDSMSMIGVQLLFDDSKMLNPLY